MPFKKTGKDTYRSPSGKTMSGAQVRAYYAKEGSDMKGMKSCSHKGKTHSGKSRKSNHTMTKGKKTKPKSGY